jgi:hypothetical protein
VLVLAVLLTAAVALVSFALSFAALRDVASWGNVPRSLAWAVPALVDSASLVYTLAALVQRQRGESARLSWFLLGLFSAVSVVANVAHGLGVEGQARTVVGVVLVGLAPVGLLASVHTLASLVVAVEPVPAPVVVTDGAPAPVSAGGAPVTTESPAEPYPSTPEPVRAPRSQARTSKPRKPSPVRRGVPIRHDPQVLAQVRAMRADGLTQRAIAEALGISQWSVADVERRARQAQASEISEQHEPLFALA